MAKSCYGRRLSELLQEQQEPFLLLLHGGGGGAIDAAPCCSASVGEACTRRLLGLCGRSALGRAVRRALRWDLAGCFSCAAARESFRRLPRAGDAVRCDPVTEFDDDEDDSARHGRQLSPVSVLELHSDEESPMGSHWEEDDRPSTSGSSPPSDQGLTGATSPFSTIYNDGKIRAMEMEVQGKESVTRSGGRSMEEQIISSWERIAGDISKIPMLVELDFSGSVQEWRWLGEEEVSRVGESLEAMIFEEMRGEAVHDMMLA